MYVDAWWYMVLSFCDSWCRQGNERYLYRDVRYQYNQQSPRYLRHCIESATKSAYTFSEYICTSSTLLPISFFQRVKDTRCSLPQETEEWLESLEALLSTHGAELIGHHAELLSEHHVLQFCQSIFEDVCFTSAVHFLDCQVHLVHPLKIKGCNIKKSPNCNPKKHFFSIHLNFPGCFSRIPVLNLGP